MRLALKISFLILIVKCITNEEIKTTSNSKDEMDKSLPILGNSTDLLPKEKQLNKLPNESVSPHLEGTKKIDETPEENTHEVHQNSLNGEGLK